MILEQYCRLRCPEHPAPCVLEMTEAKWTSLLVTRAHDHYQVMAEGLNAVYIGSNCVFLISEPTSLTEPISLI